MNTTNLFVELMVIGVGAVCALALLAAALVGLPTLALADWSLPHLFVPVLALTYLAGILVDRLADRVFGAIWGGKLRGRYFEDNGAYHEARREVLTGDQRLARQVEYSRSRVRISRGWSINALFLTVGWNALLWTEAGSFVHPGRLAVLGSLAGLVLTVACVLAWRVLASDEYLKVREGAEFLVRRRNDRRPILLEVD